MARLSLPHAQWWVEWPNRHDDLVAALAVAAAYPNLVGELKVLVYGDVDAAAAAVLRDLGDEGISDTDLPDVSLLPAPTFQVGAPVAEFTPALVAACEHERRPWRPPFPDDDPLGGEVWRVAAKVCTDARREAVTVFSETLTGAEAINGIHAVTLVSDPPMVRRAARARSMNTIPRPPAPAHVPKAGAVVLDARRPDDLALVAASAAEMALANANHVNRIALAAIAGDRDRWRRVRAA